MNRYRAPPVRIIGDIPFYVKTIWGQGWGMKKRRPPRTRLEEKHPPCCSVAGDGGRWANVPLTAQSVRRVTGYPCCRDFTALCGLIQLVAAAL